MEKTGNKLVKVGLFALAAILIIVYATIKVSEKGFVRGGTYTLFAGIESAEGLTPKTPVEIAGIEVGWMGDTELVEGRRARVSLHIKNNVKLTSDVVAEVRTKGFLGETYISLKQGDPKKGYLKNGDTINAVNPYTDISRLTDNLTGIAKDIQTITSSVKGLFENGENSSINKMIDNIAAMTDELRTLVEENRGHFAGSMEHIGSIAKKIDEGRGTLGRLINDEETIEKLNTAVDNLNETVGGFSSFQMDMGYHLEYLGESESFKNYINVGLKPRPDRAFLFEFVSDSDPSPERETIESEITTGGATTTVTTARRVSRRDDFRFSAQIAQKFHDLILRGGLIESRGGIGFDWQKEFFTASFSAFDFRNDGSDRPHLKAWGTVDLTKNLFLVGGVDDPLNTMAKTDWFVGGGVKFIDNDLKPLLGLAGSAVKK